MSYCALCDVTAVKDRIVCVVGGGASAVKEVDLLSGYAKKVVVVNNEPSLHAEWHSLLRLEASVKAWKVTVINRNEIVSINGIDRIESVTLKKPFRHRKKLNIDYVFIYVGYVLSSELAEKVGARLNEWKEVIVNEHCETNVSGFFAAGDVTTTRLKQAITAAAQGVTAAHSAYEYITKGD